MNIKDRVRDRDYDDPDDAVVILIPDESIADWEATDGVTVAEQNPDYDDDESVIIVAFQHQLAETFDWQDISADNLFQAVCEAGIKFYGFPASRLTIIGAATPAGSAG